MAQSRPLTSVSDALAGASAGIQVSQGSGQPGSDGATIRIRGTGTLNNSDPLVIVDGMEGTMDNLNPQDIESISILKDAAASAIYGSRAANGVILVTTKSGANKKISVTYTGMVSTSSPTNLIQFVSDYPTYMRLYNESITNLGNTGGFAQSTINTWLTAQKKPQRDYS
jgi:TonB-dependent SusC/RagA subfamily outer membrane receptor